MKKISFKEFVYKYQPVLNHKKDTTVMIGDAKYSSYIFNIEEHQEYVTNKNNSYVWSVVKDRDNSILLVPGGNPEAKFVCITTVPFKNIEVYVNLTKKLRFSS
jgi:hypothetical protein